MSTLAENAPESPITLHSDAIGSLFRCKRCKLAYTTQKSTSALRLTYCSFLCELGDLGFSMSGLEMMERAPIATDTPEPEPVGID